MPKLIKQWNTEELIWGRHKKSETTNKYRHAIKNPVL